MHKKLFPFLLILLLITACSERYLANHPLPSKEELARQGGVRLERQQAPPLLDQAMEYDSPLAGQLPRADGGVIGEFSFDGAASGISNRAALPAPKGEGTKEETVEILFTNASLRGVIDAVFARYIKRPYVIAPDFQDNEVSWSVSGDFTPKEVRQLLETFLTAQGVRIAERDGIYIISSNGDGAKPMSAVSQNYGVWRLRAVDAVEAAQVVRPFIGGAERVQVLDRRNVLTVIGGPAEIRAVDKFLQILDVPDFAAKRVIIYGPRYVSAEGMLTLLQNLPQQLGLNTSEGKRQIEAALIGGTRRLVIVADSAGSREAILRYIDQVDTPTAHPRQVFFYSLRNQTAEDLRNALTALLPGIIPDPAEITLVANTPSNALMISATADQYYELRKIIDRLDYRIPSVMIDATIVEVQLNDSLAYGVEWFLRGREGDLVNTAAVNLGNPLNIPSPVPGQIKLLSSQWDSRATLNLLASETNLRVLSRPRILVKNRSTATIKSIDQVRVLKSVLTTDVTVGGSNIPRREFEEKDVGITLQVTPRIAEDGSINMNVKIEDSRQGANDTSSGESQPTFNVREVNTELLSQNGQTILIGGLIKNNLSRERQKIPFFGNLPLIGDAFRNLADENQRTELIVFLTPYLASDEMSAKLLSEAVSNMAMLNPDMARNAEAPGLYLGAAQPTAVEAPPPPAPKPAKAVRKSAPRPLETPRSLPAPPDALPESSLNMPEQTPPAPPPSPDITAEDRYQPRSPGSPRGRPTLAPAPAQAN